MTDKPHMTDQDNIDRVYRYPVPFPVGSWLVPGFWLAVLVVALLLLLAG
jgi:hypothetical protein